MLATYNWRFNNKWFKWIFLKNCNFTSETENLSVKMIKKKLCKTHHCRERRLARGCRERSGADWAQWRRLWGWMAPIRGVRWCWRPTRTEEAVGLATPETTAPAAPAAPPSWRRGRRWRRRQRRRRPPPSLGPTDTSTSWPSGSEAFSVLCESIRV